MIRQMIEADIGAKFDPTPFDSETAHGLLMGNNHRIFSLFYEAAEAHEKYSRFGGSEAACESDRARGVLFVAVCEWARNKGADLTEASDAGDANG